VLLARPFGASQPAEFNRRRTGDRRSLTSRKPSAAKRLPDVLPSCRQSAQGLRNELLFFMIR
jgi:hypothetical protein